MTFSPAERRIRAALPVVRLLQIVVPLRAARWSEKRSAARVKLPDDIDHEVIFADGVRCEWLVPRNSPADRALIYLHGGWFTFGLSSLHRQMVAFLARRLAMRVLLVDYRLTPEHPFPAALNDCAAVFCWLRQSGFQATNLAIAGDSAGGNLTLATLMKLRDESEPLPAAAVCISPVGDLTDPTARYMAFRDPVLHPKAARIHGAAYVGDDDARNPLISPVYGDFRGLPPLLIHVGEDEILREDAVRIEQHAKVAGVDVDLEIYPRMWHVWQLYPALPQAEQSLDRIAAFVRTSISA